ncbi:FGGY-family carbohydrate kinase [Prochlorococcus sp. MIT 1341]|uniref:FGGY-family carbohydrate kinase n=1 Tax=Prochlorococcus sp. MIT 1341 TaxID=3096221 RepID=UPI002A762385|nr:FGGY-family carbohydrate kinase [Prochlorococcus sp. MIT 1341]
MVGRGLLFLGIDLGTSGVRLVVINEKKAIVYSSKTSYKTSIICPQDWKSCCERLIKDLPKGISQRLEAVAIDGTSGTLLACDQNGYPLGKALPYNLSCPEQTIKIKDLSINKGPASTSNGSIARALRLINKHGEKILLRHQADWINGWLLGNWRWGEEGNNIKLGWNNVLREWPSSFDKLTWKKALPEIVSSGEILGKICHEVSQRLSLPPNLKVVAGTTDSNAAVIAANSGPEDGITVLGSTLVIKRFVKEPIHGPGLTNHYLDDQWLCGGASNTGCVVLKQFFNDSELAELSRQINPNVKSGLSLRPLSRPGERFPINDPSLLPIMEPRPISDSLYLHGLLEGIANIEAKGWETLTKLGAISPKRLITIGGGARNPQWRKIREKIIGIPIRTSTIPPAAGTALLCYKAIKRAVEN